MAHTTRRWPSDFFLIETPMAMTMNTPASIDGTDNTDDHPLVVALLSGAPLSERLHAARVELARRAALYGWIDEHQDELKDPLGMARAIGREVRVLKRFIEVELADYRHQGGQAPADGPVARRVYSLLIEKVASVAVEVLGEETAHSVIEEWKRRLAEDEAVPWP